MEERKTIDNFGQIESLLDFENEHEFYMLQVLKRKKENPGMTVDSVPIKTVYIHRKGQLLELKDDLVEMAERNNARIYINPSVKSFRKCMCLCLAEMARRIAAEDYHKPYKVFDSVAGSSGSCRTPRWVLDVDWADVLDEAVPSGGKAGFLSALADFVNSLPPEGDKVVAVVPTRNGVHVLSGPFNKKMFSEAYPYVAVHQNNPTLVYIG